MSPTDLAIGIGINIIIWSAIFYLFYRAYKNGIKGWLLVLFMVTFFSIPAPLILLIQFGWSDYTSIGRIFFPIYHIFMTAYITLLVINIFRKKEGTRIFLLRYFYISLISVILPLISYTLIYIFFPQTGEYQFKKYLSDFLIRILPLIIWTLYLLFSKRVKNTFPSSHQGIISNIFFYGSLVLLFILFIVNPIVRLDFNINSEEDVLEVLDEQWNPRNEMKENGCYYPDTSNINSTVCQNLISKQNSNLNEYGELKKEIVQKHPYSCKDIALCAREKFTFLKSVLGLRLYSHI